MASIFDNIIELPNSEINEQTKSLIGFKNKYERISNNLKLLIDQEGVLKWSEKFHNRKLPLVDQINKRYPLIILAGDVGTGKTVSALSIADSMTRELKKEGFFLKLSTRVRGEGLHGQMGSLVNDAFSELKSQAGKRRLAFLLIDEADAIASSRSISQMHQEEKAAVNTLIQKIDEIRDLNGRGIVFLSTNRLHYIDEAIIRRAAVVLEFNRPNDDERKELFFHDLEGVNLSNKEIEELTKLTGPKNNDGLGFTFSDIRLKIFPEIVAKAYPDKKISFKLICDVISRINPSPEIK